jgi:hypothetical protein
MNSAKYVEEQLTALKNKGLPLQLIAWKIALLCVGWAYVFGARGQYCTPANRRARYSEDHPTIKTKCKNFDGAGTCTGCKWLPGGEKTRFFDCRGFTYWVLKLVFGWELMGAGATSQWNTASNWKAKGTVDTMPADTLVCLFVKNGAKMEHTGFGFGGETVECSAGVQHFTTMNKKWTHWGIPACIDGVVPPSPTPSPTPDKPTLRRGDSGEYVTLAQTELIQKGYDCGSFGADGEFGAATEKAVRAFQRDNTDPDTGNPLAVDGVIGSRTWAALDAVEPATKYTVTIPHLSKSQADALISQYPGSTMTEERG